MSLLFISKILVTIGTVLALSAVAERVSPRAAGILSGYPLGAAIALFFMGVEIGPEFAAMSAVYTQVGLVALQLFVYVYFRVSAALSRRGILISSLAALGAYFAASALLRLVPFSAAGALLLPLASAGLFVFLFRRIENVPIVRSVRFTGSVLALRAGAAALMIVAVTGAAHAVGPAWAGLFAAFPIALFPLMLIVHMTYGKSQVHTIIKNFPVGIGALMAYTVSVAALYPSMGVGWGTVASFGAATLYLLLYSAGLQRMRRRSRRAPLGGAEPQRTQAAEGEPVMDKNLTALIDTAIRREEEAHRFYMDLHARAGDAAIKETLAWMAAEEEKHRAFLVAYRAGRFGAEPLRMSDVVSYRIAEHHKEPDPAQATGREDIFLLAAHREARAHAFYRELAEQHPPGEARDTLLRMANEELKHKEKVEYLYSNTAFPQTSGG
ncbi:MAG: ferritin family protein [Desulfobacterales bacterium]|nr:ferritin family protein [Desulfobacterales bacterium]